MPQTKILMIEDNSSDVFLLRRALNAVHKDFELEIAADGDQALRFIHNGGGQKEAHPCVILLDLHLPKHDGLEILHAIRQNPNLKHVHVMVTTNAASPREAEELRRMGIECRPKPRDLEGVQRLATDLIAICNGSEISA